MKHRLVQQYLSSMLQYKLAVGRFHSCTGAVHVTDHMPQEPPFKSDGKHHEIFLATAEETKTNQTNSAGQQHPLTQAHRLLYTSFPLLGSCNQTGLVLEAL